MVNEELFTCSACWLKPRKMASPVRTYGDNRVASRGARSLRLASSTETEANPRPGGVRRGPLFFFALTPLWMAHRRTATLQP